MCAKKNKIFKQLTHFTFDTKSCSMIKPSSDDILLEVIIHIAYFYETNLPTSLLIYPISYINFGRVWLDIVNANYKCQFQATFWINSA